MRNIRQVPTPVEPDDVLRQLRRDGVSWQELDDQAVVLDLASSSYFQSNPTGRLLLAMLVEGATVTAMARALCERFGITTKTALADAKAFVSHLDDHGLLEPP
jgi:Coenzyme PQQ synthesis protein D (PqqD)